jgi:hypothetical protein
MSTLFDIWNTIQSSLFPRFEGELDTLSKKEKQFIKFVSLLDLGKHLNFEFSMAKNPLISV